MHSFKYSSYKAFLNIFFKFIIQKKGGNHWIENVLSVESVYAVKISEPSRQIYWLLNKKKILTVSGRKPWLKCKTFKISGNVYLCCHFCWLRIELRRVLWLYFTCSDFLHRFSHSLYLKTTFIRRCNDNVLSQEVGWKTTIRHDTDLQPEPINIWLL